MGIRRVVSISTLVLILVAVGVVGLLRLGHRGKAEPSVRIPTLRWCYDDTVAHPVDLCKTPKPAVTELPWAAYKWQ